MDNGVHSWSDNFTSNISGYQNWQNFDFVENVHTNSSTCDTSKDDVYSTKPQQIIAIALGILGIFGNVVSLFAIIKLGSNSLTANLRLVISLCMSDILTSIGVIIYICIEHNISDAESEDISENSTMCLSVGLRCFRMFAHIISLFNLCGLAFDNYSSLVKPLQYAATTFNNKATCIILLFWIIAFILGFSKFLLPIALPSYCKKKTEIEFCERIYCSQFDSEYVVFVLTFLCLFGMLGIYIVIFIKLQRPVLNHKMYRQQRRNRRGVLTTILILVTFMICWLPYCIFEIAMTLRIRSSSDLSFMINDFRVIRTVDFYLYDLLLLNSIFDPLIYAKRLTEVRTGYRFLRKFLLQCSQNKDTFGDGLVSTSLLLRENNANHSNAQSRKASQTTTKSF